MAKQKQKKQLTLEVVDQLHKPYEEQKEVEFKGYVFSVDKKFSDTKFINLIKDFIRILDEIKNKGINIDDILDKLISLQYILVIKHFTSIPIPDNLKVEQLLTLLSKFIDLGLLKFILNEAFDQEELKKITEKFGEFARNTSKLNKELEQELINRMDEIEKLAQEVDNDA